MTSSMLSCNLSNFAALLAFMALLISSHSPSCCILACSTTPLIVSSDFFTLPATGGQTSFGIPAASPRLFPELSSMVCSNSSSSSAEPILVSSWVSGNGSLMVFPWTPFGNLGNAYQITVEKTVGESPESYSADFYLALLGILDSSSNVSETCLLSLPCETTRSDSSKVTRTFSLLANDVSSLKQLYILIYRDDLAPISSSRRSADDSNGESSPNQDDLEGGEDFISSDGSGSSTSSSSSETSTLAPTTSSTSSSTEFLSSFSSSAPTTTTTTTTTTTALPSTGYASFVLTAYHAAARRRATGEVTEVVNLVRVNEGGAFSVERQSSNTNPQSSSIGSRDSTMLILIIILGALFLLSCCVLCMRVCYHCSIAVENRERRKARAVAVRHTETMQMKRLRRHEDYSSKQMATETSSVESVEDQEINQKALRATYRRDYDNNNEFGGTYHDKNKYRSSRSARNRNTSSKYNTKLSSRHRYPSSSSLSSRTESESSYSSQDSFTSFDQDNNRNYSESGKYRSQRRGDSFRPHPYNNNNNNNNNNSHRNQFNNYSTNAHYQQQQNEPAVIHDNLSYGQNRNPATIINMNYNNTLQRVPQQPRVFMLPDANYPHPPPPAAYTTMHPRAYPPPPPFPHPAYRQQQAILPLPPALHSSYYPMMTAAPPLHQRLHPHEPTRMGQGHFYQPPPHHHNHPPIHTMRNRQAQVSAFYNQQHQQQGARPLVVLDDRFGDTATPPPIHGLPPVAAPMNAHHHHQMDPSSMMYDNANPPPLPPRNPPPAHYSQRQSGTVIEPEEEPLQLHNQNSNGGGNLRYLRPDQMNTKNTNTPSYMMTPQQRYNPQVHHGRK